MSDTVLMTMALTPDRIAMGNELTFPRMQAYAKRCGMDFHVLADARRSLSVGEIYDWERADRLYELLGTYVRVVHLEDDVIVRQDAADVIELPLGVFWGFDNAPLNPEEVERCGKETASVWPEEFSGISRLHHLYNVGMFVADRSQRELFAPPSRELYDKWRGTGLLNMRLQRLGVRSMDPGRRIFNLSYLWGEAEPAPDFLHVLWFDGPKREGVEKFIKRMDG